MGNISKHPGLLVNALFNRGDRKFRRISGRRHRKKLNFTSSVENCLQDYKSFFVFNISPQLTS